MKWNIQPTGVKQTTHGQQRDTSLECDRCLSPVPLGDVTEIYANGSVECCGMW